MMAEFEGIHPDEGTIHAWLDDALDAAGSARVEAHVAECASCAESVAEARGLIAGASRVVGLLDDRPLPLIRPAVSPTNGTDLSLWRLLRVTPARSAIAAILLVAVGITLTRGRIAVESTARPTAASDVVTVMAPAEERAAPQAMSAQEATAPDSVLASAVSKRIAQDQPARGMGAAPGITIPVAPPATAANVPTLNSAPAREVARGRMEAQLSAVTVMGAIADKVSARPEVAAVAGAVCYRLTSADSGAATWGGVVLPMEMALASTGMPPDADGARFAITGVRGGRTMGSWSRLPGDQLSLSLRGLGATTVGVLAPAGQTLAGTLTARFSNVSLSEVVVTGVASSRVRARVDSTPPRAAADARGSPVQRDSAPARARDDRRLQVVATRIDCPQ